MFLMLKPESLLQKYRVTFSPLAWNSHHCLLLLKCLQGMFLFYLTWWHTLWLIHSLRWAYLINNYCHPTRSRFRGKRPKDREASPLPSKAGKIKGQWGWLASDSTTVIRHPISYFELTEWNTEKFGPNHPIKRALLKIHWGKLTSE